MLTIEKSKKFKGMFAIIKDGKVFDEPHASICLAKEQIKRYDLRQIKVNP